VSSAAPLAVATSRIIRRSIWLFCSLVFPLRVSHRINLIRRGRSAGDVVIARRNVVEDHLDK
jgi:hypothetical protein